jgi:CheY-like chemotaxis protein
MARILVAEDEAIVRLLVVETLRSCGHTVEEAADGQAALDVIQTCADLDLIVSDIRLPKMDGFAMARSARALRPELRLLFLTGYIRAELPDDLSPAIIIRKPFNPDSLANKVAEMLEAKLAAPG